MKVALVQAPAWGRDCPPYTLAYFNALLKLRGHEPFVFDVNNALYQASSPDLKKYWDDKDYYSYWENASLLKNLLEGNAAEVERIVNAVLGTGARVIGFTTHTTSFIISLELARRIRKKDPSRIIVFGGPQCSRSQAIKYLARRKEVDYACTGEGDIAFPALLSALESGHTGPFRGFHSRTENGVVDLGDPEIPLDLDALPMPDYEPFRADMEAGKYREPGRLDIFDSRGCTTCCHFCSEWQYWKKYRTMSGKRIFEEISAQMKRFPQVNTFYCNGSLINGDLSVLEDWCDRIIKSGLRVRWLAQAIARSDMTAELLKKMKRAGCAWLGFGIESGSQRLLDAMNKRYSAADAVRVLRDAHDAGISTQVNIMFGMPTETAGDFEQTLAFVKMARPSIDTILASQSFCVLDKGTYLRRNPRKFGITGTGHHLYWKSNKGENDYAERFRRYEAFCREALRLGIPETSGVLAVKPDKWFLLGSYYRREKDYAKAAECFKKSLALESENRETRALMNECARALEKKGKTA